MKNCNFIAGAIASFVLAFAPHAGVAQEDAPRQVLFSNVNIFDGVNDGLMQNASVLVEGNLIKTISADPIEAPAAYTVDGEGRTLMPGMIDMHSPLC